MEAAPFWQRQRSSLPHCLIVAELVSAPCNRSFGRKPVKPDFVGAVPSSTATEIWPTRICRGGVRPCMARRLVRYGDGVSEFRVITGWSEKWIVCPKHQSRYLPEQELPDVDMVAGLVAPKLLLVATHNPVPVRVPSFDRAPARRDQQLAKGYEKLAPHPPSQTGWSSLHLSVQ
jgi:hypothetical protein